MIRIFIRTKNEIANHRKVKATDSSMELRHQKLINIANKIKYIDEPVQEYWIGSVILR